MNGFVHPDLAECRRAVEFHAALTRAAPRASQARAHATHKLLDMMAYLAPDLHPSIMAQAQVVYALNEDQHQYFRDAALEAATKYVDIAFAENDAKSQVDLLNMRLQRETAANNTSKAAADKMAAVVQTLRAENEQLRAALSQQQAAMAAAMEATREQAAQIEALIEENQAQAAAAIAAAHIENARLQAALEDQAAAMEDQAAAMEDQAAAMEAAARAAEERVVQLKKAAQDQRNAQRRQITALRCRVREAATPAVPVANAASITNEGANSEAPVAVPRAATRAVFQRADQVAPQANAANVDTPREHRQQPRAGLARPTKASVLRQAAIKRERETKQKAIDEARAKDVVHATNSDRTRTRTASPAHAHAAANLARGPRH